MINKPLKVFVSHASEDKERFVERFSTLLRENGVDAWTSFWEINDGDSLVKKIFDEGIKESSQFIVILSQNSINKPWIQKELSIAIVKQIEDKYKIIPILLDDVKIPISLKDTAYRRIKDLTNFDDEVKGIIDSIYGLYKKPILGKAPAYNSTLIQLPELSKIDNHVLNICFDLLKDWDFPPFVIALKDLIPEAKKININENDVFDSLHFLKDKYYLKGEFAYGYGRKFLHNPMFTTGGFQKVALLKIEGFVNIVSDYATYIYNELSNNEYTQLNSKDLAQLFNLPISCSSYVVKILEEKKLCEISETIGCIWITRITPTLKRWIENK
jgi:hypothetical protein